ncbi:MAG: helix-hairpin-helix domain-containing protein [Chloroflexota bacterium]
MQTERYQSVLILVLVFLAAVGAALWYARAPSGEPLVVATPTGSGARSSAAEANAEGRIAKVYLTGGVVRPGVYTVPPGARVEDVVKAAGGLAVDADRERVNLASTVRDGQHIHVPTFRESLSANGSNSSIGQSSSSKVNINTASVAELERLPRVGEVIANRIVTYRQANGPFRRIEELKEFRLVGEADFEQIKDLVCVD